MWQSILTGIIVILAVAYAAWKLMPRAGRLRIAQGLVRMPMLHVLAARLIARESASVCSACAGSHRTQRPSHLS